VACGIAAVGAVAIALLPGERREVVPVRVRTRQAEAPGAKAGREPLTP
jgi:hypothetical protein